MTTETTIIAQLKASVNARKDSLRALRGRISALLDPIPVGVVLADEAGEVCRIIRVCTGASQWGDRTWDITIRGRGAVAADGRLLCEDLESSRFDGHNIHYRSSEPTHRWAGEIAEQLDHASGSRTRELAARLPAAIARYMQQCEAEAAANTAAAAAI